LKESARKEEEKNEGWTETEKEKKINKSCKQNKWSNTISVLQCSVFFFLLKY
jgi:hypothetical protein